MNMKVTELNIESQVIKVVSDYFSVGRRNIESGSRLVEDLYVDSMSLVEIVMALNETFEVELPAAGVAQWKTVADIVSLVRAHCER